MDGKRCNNCGVYGAPGAAFCGACGQKFNESVYCRNCGTSINPNQAFCTKCGANILGETAAQSDYERGYEGGQKLLFKLFPKLAKIEAVGRGRYWKSFFAGFFISFVCTFFVALVVYGVAPGSIISKVIVWLSLHYVFIRFFGHMAYGRLLDIVGSDAYETKRVQLNWLGLGMITLGLFGTVGTFLSSLGSIVFLIVLGAMSGLPKSNDATLG